MNQYVESLIEEICSKEISERKINKEPLCILLGGLPGSGKTNLIKKMQNHYKERDFLIIDTDNYRKLHPDYKKLIKMPEYAVDATSEFSNMIELILIKKAIEKHCDIISVSTLRATEVIKKVLYEPAIKFGYKIEASIMSVPIRECGLSAQIRYENQIIDGEISRFTPMNFIESSLEGIKNTIQFLEDKKKNITVRVYSRGNSEKSLPIEIYSSQKNDIGYATALEAFENPIEQLDSNNAIELINKLYILKQNRNANIVEYSSLERLKELFNIEKVKRK